MQRDAELREIAGLLGHEALQDRDRAIIDVARIAREHVLGQSAFDPNDAASSVKKTGQLARLVVAALDAAQAAVDHGAAVEDLDLTTTRKAISAVRFAPPEALAARVADADAAIAKVAATAPVVGASGGAS